MLFRESSLRKKIILGYIAGLVIILIAASFILLNLVFIEERIKFFSVITRFVDTVLEIRRYEKNYFLYKQPDDLERLQEYIDNALVILKRNYSNFDIIRPSSLDIKQGDDRSTSDIAIEMISRYKILIQTAKEERDVDDALQEEVRKTGHELTKLAEDLSNSERDIIKKTIVSTKRSLILSLVVFFTGTVFIGIMVSTLVIRPLKELEQSMNSIASGRFEMLHIDSHDQEIISLKKAFERMVKEIFSQRDIIRSEKLKSLGTMLAGIAHEINNPLSNISTSAEILEEEINGPDSEFKKELIQQIIRETDRARDIVRSVLDYTREREFRKEEVSLSELISRTMRFVKSDIPSHVTIHLDIPEGLVVRVDRQKLQHALLNIIKNAIDAMSDINREGILAIKGYELGDTLVSIEISDTGTGISDDNLHKIFDPFFTTKDVGKGTGLGLFISHNIIRQHRGEISVKSTPGRGTTFTITLPKE